MTSVLPSHPPQTFDEYLVGMAEYQEGCVKTEAVIPPPVSCGEVTDVLYRVAQWHLFSIAITVVFLFMIIQLTKLALKIK
ncbi:TPA: hypothetical protein DEP34_05200 [Candidatus Uhrbacteria bacterium]|uniref:Uncharacterized protein n=2 Tax=Candidatus Uhriibacteriota TaxID=1752732 RepID=A0A0G1T4X5_9BACT|nr:MAG: hypothetical protein UX45_C0017G0003 [Candidatus Uhrbacteria bacterium GW2011_GWF2_46_218]KKU40470.1 MAG: hypothetical protein UX57_C0016G0003 [Candidatus Uhrbacteria bacterium GW2011_GWE2_46_68]HBK34016.1 hypothetical protein [Candidatus Uhrbacteria bacterium]HCB19735.1 hypothetical protein [Candidatus Uhrbacteria bacterium]